jgi:hypothetical protein
MANSLRLRASPPSIVHRLRLPRERIRPPATNKALGRSRAAPLQSAHRLEALASSRWQVCLGPVTLVFRRVTTASNVALSSRADDGFERCTHVAGLVFPTPLLAQQRRAQSCSGRSGNLSCPAPNSGRARNHLVILAAAAALMNEALTGALSDVQSAGIPARGSFSLGCALRVSLFGAA